jgi:hypothetical protein
VISALSIVFAGAMLAAVMLGDAATAAAIAGMFSVINTALTALALKWLRGTRRDIQTTHSSVANAAVAAAAASEAATEACRVAKSIGRSIRHEDPLVIRRASPPAPELPE